MGSKTASAAYLSQYEPEHLVVIGHREEPPIAMPAGVQLSEFQHWRAFTASSVAKNDSSSRMAGLLLLSSAQEIDDLGLVLGAATRAFPWHLLVEDRTEAAHENTAFFAYAFRQLNTLAGTPKSCRLFEYRLHDYKPVPEWLNSRFWAHPERFNAV